MTAAGGRAAQKGMTTAYLQSHNEDHCTVMATDAKGIIQKICTVLVGEKKKKSDPPTPFQKSTWAPGKVLVCTMACIDTTLGETVLSGMFFHI